jgi:hypothetical protein
VGIAVVVFELARGRSPADALGNYSVTGSGGYEFWPALKWLVWHIAELDLALWVVPFAAAIVLVANARHLDRNLRVFLAASVSLSLWLVLVVAVFASRYSGRVEERNLFYVMPLFLIALLAWIERGQPRPSRATIAAAVAAAALPGTLSFPFLLGGVNSESDTLGLRPWWYLRNVLVGEDTVALVAVLVALALAAAFLWLPRRWAAMLPALVAAGFLSVWLPLQLWDYGFPKAAEGAWFQGIGRGDRDWIDARVGRDADVAAIWTGRGTNYFTIWENEFFNRSLRRVYDLGTPLPGEMPEIPLHVDRASGELRTPEGRPLRARYVLTDALLRLEGRVLARNSLRDLVLVEPRGRARLTLRITGLYPNDTWSGPEAEWIRTDCNGGSLTVRVSSDPSLFPRGQTITAHSGSVTRVFRLSPKQERSFTVPIPGRCDVRFAVTPTAVPAETLPGSSDTRRLGVHFNAFDYRPKR